MDRLVVVRDGGRVRVPASLLLDGGVLRSVVLGVLRCAVLVALLSLHLASAPCVAEPESDCAFQVSASYVDGPYYGTSGSEYDVVVSLGSGSITGGATNTVSLSTVRFFLDCTHAELPNCQDNGNVMSFVTVVWTNCGTLDRSFWTPQVSGNIVDLNAASPVVIPANQPAPPGFCSLMFRIRVESLDAAETDVGTPYFVEENTEVKFPRCDNGLYGYGSSWTGLELCHRCNDHDPCTKDTCNTVSGQCETTSGGPPEPVHDMLTVSNAPSHGAALSWFDAHDPGGTYNVYRGSRASGAWSYDETCLAPGVTSMEATDDSLPSTGATWYYLVSRKASCGESPLGFDSGGAPIPVAVPCP